MLQSKLCAFPEGFRQFLLHHWLFHCLVVRKEMIIHLLLESEIDFYCRAPMIKDAPSCIVYVNALVLSSLGEECCYSPYSWLSESFITQIQYLTITCKRLVHLLSLIGCFIVFQTCLSCAFNISVSTIVQIKGCLSPTWWRNFVVSRCHVSMACIFLV